MAKKPTKRELMLQMAQAAAKAIEAKVNGGLTADDVITRDDIVAMGGFPAAPGLTTREQHRAYEANLNGYFDTVRREVYKSMGRALATMHGTGGFQLLDADDSAPYLVDEVHKITRRKSRRARSLAKSSSKGLSVEGVQRKRQAFDRLALLDALAKRTEKVADEEIRPTRAARSTHSALTGNLTK